MRPLTFALALFCAIAPAHAGTPGQDLLLSFGGAPSWVLKPPGGPAPTIDMNFATGQYYGLQPSQLSVTRASPDNEVCNGTLYQFANNVAPITPCGLWAWEARTNSVPNNTNQGAGVGTYPTGWSIYNPSGATVTVLGATVTNGVSFLGVQLSGNTTSNSGIQILQTSSTGIAATAGQVWSQSIYAYYSGSLTGITSVGAQANWNTSGGAYVNGPFGVTFTPTTNATRYQQSNLIAGATVAFLQPLISINITTGQTLNATMYFALEQMELNPNLLASVASATVAGGGAAYVGASGTMTWSGTGCTTNPVLNVTTSAGAINAVTSVATAGSCTTFPPAGATTWTPGGGLSVGTGASFNLVPTNNSAQAFATGPILTSGAAVARNQNVIAATTPNPLSTIYAKIAPQSALTFPVAEWALAYGGTNGLGLLTPAGAYTATYSAGGSTFSMGIGSFTQSVYAPFALAYNGGTENVMFNGLTATASNAATVSGSTLYIGSNASGALPCNCAISRVAGFASKLTTGQVAGLH